MDPLHAADFFDVSAASKYSVLDVLGEGAFGDVRMGINNHTGDTVAMKFVRIVSRQRIIPNAVFREIESLRQLGDCRNIVRLHDVFAHETSVCLVMEYVESDLAEVITAARRPIPMAFCKRYVHSLLESLAYCHAHSIVHRDVKPTNLLINSLGQLKLGDFGLARTIVVESGTDAGTEAETGKPPPPRDPLSHQVATRWYRAPELLFASRTYDFAVDMWAAGAVLGEMWALQPLFPGTSDIDQIFRVLQIMGTPTDELWPSARELPDYSKIIFPDMQPVQLDLLLPHVSESGIDFLRLFLQLDPALRATASEALTQHADFFYGNSPGTAPPMAALAELPKPPPRTSKPVQKR